MTAPLPSLQEPDNDPYLFLEEIEGPEALAFVDRETERTLARLGGPAVDADTETLGAILNRPDNIPHITRRGGHVYNFWKDAAQPKGLWRRTSLENYRTAAPAWDVLIDLDVLAASEGEDWVWGGGGVLPHSHDRAILRLSRGGADAVVLREFDLVTRQFVAGGFNLPEAKGGAVWIDRDSVLLMTALGGHTTEAGYARQVKLWRRGEAHTDARMLFEVPGGHMSAWAGIDRTVNPHRVFYVDQIGFFDAAISIGGLGGPETTIDVPTDCEISIHADWMAAKPRTPWTIGTVTHPSDRLLGIRLSAFLKGNREFVTLFEPAARKALSGFQWAGGQLVVSILDDLKPRFERHTPSDQGWRREPITGLPDIGVAHVWPVDAEEADATGELLALTQDPLTPATLQLVPLTGAPEILKRAPQTFTAEGHAVTRHDAVSVDGERIPYVQIGPVTNTGDAPVHMLGYGGFGLAETPAYRSGIGKLWLERGGTSVIAHLRGGGEFGSPWHDAGRREKKRLSHDDFAAIAADLVRRGVTVPKRIAAEGGSNGGILISNMLTRYPERFGALFCTIPLIDMRRYSKLLAGASWIAEYGDPDAPEDWAFLQHISAYHNVEAGKSYPPILIATTRRDDRVHPGHARKFAAKLRALGYDALFYEPAAGGHGYGKDNRERARFTALGLAFLRRAIGWEGA